MTSTTMRLAAAFLTDLADADVTLPLAGALTLLLAVLRADLAWRWVLVVGGTLGVILLFKLLFGVLIALGALIGIRSPSGHTCSSSLVYGGMALLLDGRRRVAVAVACAVAVLIGWTRLALGAHSVAEVVLGGAIGVGGVALLGRATAARPTLRPAQRILLLPVAAVVLSLCYGGVAGIEGRLDKLEYRADRAFGLPTWAGERAYLKLYGG